MGTAPRSFSKGFYHVFSRGNHKDVIFRDKADRRHFLSKLDQFCDRDGLGIIAYCLMDNHFHLLLRQTGPRPVTVAMRSLLAGYARRYNSKYGTVGSLFQGRFQAKPVGDEGYLVSVSRYIHLNPHPFNDYRKYRWSSYAEYVTGRPGFCQPGPVLDLFGGSTTSYAIYVEKAASYGDAKNAAPRQTSPHPA